MLPGAGIWGNDSGHGTVEGGRVYFRVGFIRQYGEDWSTGSGRRDYGGGVNGGSGRYFGSLISAKAHMLQGQDNICIGAAKEVGEVPDGLHYGV